MRRKVASVGAGEQQGTASLHPVILVAAEGG